jgi:Cu-processing system permease protein
LILAIVFLGLSALISILCRRETKTFGISLLIWFFFVMFYDVLILGISLLLKERAANYFIFASLFGNPVDMIRVAGLIVLAGEEVFGAAGAALVKFLGGEFFGLVALTVGICVWTVVPFFIALKIWQHQDI